jgi:thiosulfate/3-mercaptopyruvate sulfurtransferase
MTNNGELIGVQTFKRLLETTDCRAVDCRFDLFDPGKGRRDYLGGHIPGAVHADMDKDLASKITPDSGRHPLPDPAVFRETLENWGISDDTHVVAYDYGNGSLAVRLWWMLRWLGHDRVSVLDGGYGAWAAGNELIEQDVPDHVAGNFNVSPNENMIATTAEIAAAVISNTEINLIDARDEARFRGEKEPIDPIAGRVPGARNMPLSRNLNSDGTWRSPAALVEIWDAFDDGRNSQEAVVMCGSGVTACHLILSAVLAGRSPPRLYVGSWSEWIRDKNRPVATGD